MFNNLWLCLVCNIQDFAVLTDKQIKLKYRYNLNMHLQKSKKRLKKQRKAGPVGAAPIGVNISQDFSSDIILAFNTSHVSGAVALTTFQTDPI